MTLCGESGYLIVQCAYVGGSRCERVRGLGSQVNTEWSIACQQGRVPARGFPPHPWQGPGRCNAIARGWAGSLAR
jgi:hypothetical protein